MFVVEGRVRFLPGNVIEFNYAGEKSSDPKPRIAVIGVHKKLVHGINLKYLSKVEQRNLKRVFALPRVSKAIGIRDEGDLLHHIDFNTKDFYDKYLKKYVDKMKTNAYRTYSIDKISTPQQIDSWLQTTG